VSSYDPAELARKAGIAENDRFDVQGHLDEVEAIRCFACGFRSKLPGTPVFAWRRARPDMEPLVIELCEICNVAAGGPPGRKRVRERNLPKHGGVLVTRIETSVVETDFGPDTSGRAHPKWGKKRLTVMAIDIGQIEGISPRPETLWVSKMKEQLPRLRQLKELARDHWAELGEPQQAALRELLARVEAVPKPSPAVIGKSLIKFAIGLLFDYAEYHRTLFLYAAELAGLVEVIRVHVREDAVCVAEAEAGVTIALANAPSFDELLLKSYAHDYASQLARITVRRRPPEAADCYFEDAEDSGEISPVLQRFRERTAFQLQSV